MAPSEKSTLLPTANDSNLQGGGSWKRVPKSLVAIVVFGVGVLVVALAWWAIASTNASPHAQVPTTTAGEYICGNTPNEAGYITLANKKDDHYFYWFFEAENDPETAPLAIWLTGGPGGSSMLALFLENGPCRIQADLSTEVHPYSWTKNANMIWLDQPTAVGFSYGAQEDEDFDESDVGANLYWFLQGFLEKHPEFDGREFFLTGESYAGHYVPGAAHYIWEQNRLGNPTPGARAINLQGIAVGNGWTDPVVQYKHQGDILDNKYNITLLTDAQLEQFNEDMPKCIELTEACQKRFVAQDPNRTDICFNAQQFCYDKIVGPFRESNTGRNPYDIREKCDFVAFGFCGGVPLLEGFFNQTKVLEYIHAAGPWVGGSDIVGYDFMAFGDYSSNVDDYVKVLLDGGIRVLLYVGDADSMCNWGGNKAWIDALTWSGHVGFNAAEERAFLSRDPLDTSAPVVEAGTVQSFENLALVRIYNAGHMVPTHQPAVSLDLISRFFSNEAI
jgi:carboxypeptidase C (cathepsin A)